MTEKDDGDDDRGEPDEGKKGDAAIRLLEGELLKWSRESENGVSDDVDQKGEPENVPADKERAIYFAAAKGEPGDDGRGQPR